MTVQCFQAIGFEIDSTCTLLHDGGDGESGEDDEGDEGDDDAVRMVQVEHVTSTTR